MKGILFSILALALGGMSPAHAATASACGPRQSAVQRLFCRHPALAAMDRSVQALAATLASPASRRDQRVWQSQRDDALWRMLSNRSFGEDAVLRRAWSLERSRQAFLLGRAGHGAVVFAPMDRMARTLRQHREAASDPLDTWARFDGKVVLARSLSSLPNDPGRALGRVGLRPDPALADRIDTAGMGGAGLDLVWLPEARLGAVISVQGSAYCQIAIWFHADREGQAHAIPSPMLDQAPCGRARLTLLRVGYDTYAALQRSDGPYSVDVSVQQWLDGRWASPLRQRMRYDHALEPGRIRCAGKACAGYAGVLAGIARQYDAHPQGPFMPPAHPQAGERARRLLHLAQHGRKTTLGNMPLDGGEAMTTFCSDASFFLVRVDGRLLLGRIGHGYLGWRRSDGWRIGLWDMRGSRLVAVASAVIHRPRGRLLALATMPPEVIPTR